MDLHHDIYFINNNIKCTVLLILLILLLIITNNNFCFDTVVIFETFPSPSNQQTESLNCCFYVMSNCQENPKTEATPLSL